MLRYIVRNSFHNFKNIYRTSILSYFWVVLQPLVMLALYTMIFSQLMQAKLEGIESEYSYALYLSVGILPWAIFVTAITSGTNSIINNQNYIKKIAMPIYVYVFQSVVEQLFHLIIVFILLFIFLYLFGIPFSVQWFLVIIPIGFLVVLILGVSMILSPLNAFFRDVDRAVSILLQVLMWSIPIIYPISIIPDHIQWVILYNPLYYYFDSIREILLYGNLLSLKYILVMSLTSGVTFLLGFRVITSLDSDIRDGL